MYSPCGVLVGSGLSYEGGNCWETLVCLGAAFEEVDEIDTADETLVGTFALLDLEVRTSGRVAVGVLSGGLLAGSQVNAADTKSCFDAVVVPKNIAILSPALAIVGRTQLLGVSRRLIEESRQSQPELTIKKVRHHANVEQKLVSCSSLSFRSTKQSTLHFRNTDVRLCVLFSCFRVSVGRTR